MRRSIVPVAFALGVAGALPAAAAELHIRGTVAKVDGPAVTVTDRDGKPYRLTLGENWKIAGMVPAALSDIKAGSFVGTANVPGASGAKALEVVVFPEAMRGVGEGEHGWDLKPGSAMTNATVQSQVQGVDGQTLSLAYKGGEKKVTIPPGTPIVTVAPATAADVVTGAAVFVGGEAGAAEGTLDKGFIAVGKDGVVPPM